MAIKDHLSSLSKRTTSSDSSSSYVECDVRPDKSELLDDLVKRTSKLRLDEDSSKLPTPDQAYVHLKLLHAFAVLRKSICEHDGLFHLDNQDVVSALSQAHADKDVEKAMLARLAEKRWSIFVSRAVDRFTIWWDGWRRVNGARMLTMSVFTCKARDELGRDWFNGHGKRTPLSKDNLPPLDVLMVWHSFMLNPRCYLEDCLRQDMMTLWHTAFPWSAINASIDAANGHYTPGKEAIQEYEKSNGMQWSNIDNPNTKTLQCPSSGCKSACSVSWSSINREDLVHWAKNASPDQSMPLGSGYADPGFGHRCLSCYYWLDHDVLRAAKFLHDSESIINTDPSKAMEPNAIPMPGTILNSRGIYESIRWTGDLRLLPNRLVREMFVESETRDWCTSINGVSVVLNKALEEFKDGKVAKYAHHMRSKPRVYVRKMMSRYWNNSSIFCLDLAGAVIRQGNFIEKMQGIDWLHSPAALVILARFTTKYTRFFKIMTSRLNKITVPTLDVDLLWHTHQLTPSNYHSHCLANTHPATYIDHDDKIGEVKLHDAFSETTRIYQKRYKEPYSECTCWYCESVRAAYDSNTSHFSTRSSALHTAEDRILYGSSNPAPSDPDQAPHISTHNAIRPAFPDEIGRRNRLQARNNGLAILFAKASQRARKAERKEPQRHDVPTDSPHVPAAPITMSGRAIAAAGAASFLYTGAFEFNNGDGHDDTYIANPGCASTIVGSQVGNCVAGTCGAMVAAGGRGDLAECAAGQVREGNRCSGGGGTSACG